MEEGRVRLCDIAEELGGQHRHRAEYHPQRRENQVGQVFRRKRWMTQLSSGGQKSTA